ncbi:bypass of forespore C-like protein [Scopulibacillus darangshiensis]|uniref:Bypass of forespore C-like protein n=1 Tax=Scopulibacillus darangshiensis TaxID=442528 RepID=A0A4R2PCX6_9BACL|nr:BofC C-terminal domain-containing protein [Scopulibacillus darangshiensis]TCP32254.1 bypass of forespore C-like protein [Scopulibacillus darangshiensis]
MIRPLFLILSIIGLLAANGGIAAAGQSYTQKPHIVHVHLEKIFLDGISIEESKEEHPLSMEVFWKSYKDWVMVKKSDGQIYLKKKINDISPIAKTKGIFGLTDHTTLTIFKGDPNNHKIIQTFFQIDTQALEAADVQKLLKGFPVKDKQHFTAIMKSLAKYEKH